MSLKSHRGGRSANFSFVDEIDEHLARCAGRLHTGIDNRQILRRPS